MSEKIKKAELLLDRIGEIDDDLLAEALSYRPRRRNPRIALIAACIALSVILVFGAVGALDFISSDSLQDGAMNSLPNEMPTEAPTEAPVQPPSISVADTLDEVFADLGGGYEKLSESELPYRDGNSYLVWQYSGESEFYISSLDDSQLASIEREMGKGSDVGETSPELEYMVWIISDGEVCSPYLKDNQGNVCSEIFDYDPEIYPTTDFVSYVSAILQ